MKHLLCAFGFLVLLPAHPLAAREPAPTEDKGTFLGVLFCPIPEALHAHLPDLPREGGVLITHVLPDSPAAAAKLARHDILLQYNKEKIHDSDHLARLIRASRPGEMVDLILVRAGKPTTARVQLGLGPVLKIVQATLSGSTRILPESPRGVAKPGTQPAVTVSATPLDNNRVKITFEFYQDGTGRLRSVPCVGTPDEIDQQVQQLPPKVQEIARVAVKRIRDLQLQRSAPATSPPIP